MIARVYFSESDGDYWLKRWLMPGFSHCFVVVDGILINPCFHYTQAFNAEALYECTTYIDIDMKEPEKKHRTIWQVFTCVTMVKSFIGMNKYAILTPYQLFQYLQRHQDGK